MRAVKLWKRLPTEVVPSLSILWGLYLAACPGLRWPKPFPTWMILWSHHPTAAKGPYLPALGDNSREPACSNFRGRTSSPLPLTGPGCLPCPSVLCPRYPVKESCTGSSYIKVWGKEQMDFRLEGFPEKKKKNKCNCNHRVEMSNPSPRVCSQAAVTMLQEEETGMGSERGSKNLRFPTHPAQSMEYLYSFCLETELPEFSPLFLEFFFFLFPKEFPGAWRTVLCIILGSVLFILISLLSAFSSNSAWPWGILRTS